jgi:outer membrane protein TolC
LKDLEGILALAQRLFDQSDLRFKEGTGLVTELLENEAMLRESKVNYTTGLLDYYIAQLDYHKARGTLMDFLNIE